MFAVPSDPGVFSDFEYEAIAISYNNSDLVKALEISAFDGQSNSYVIYPDGRVLVDNTNSGQRTVYNFLAMMRNYTDMDDAQLKELQKSFQQGESGITTFRMDNVNYYLIYEAVDFEN